MGTGRNDPDQWAAYTTATSAKSTSQIFTASKMPDEFNPANINLRESRDSNMNPNSNAIVIGSDGSGSMDILAEALIRKGIGVAFEEILKRNSLSDPHLLVMGIGDVHCDRSPLQVTQFEADSVVLGKQLEKMHIEQGGGGNGSESYTLPWYFAAERTAIDCFEKRGKKGYLFTMGDEGVPPNLTREQIKKALGITIEQDSISNRSLLAMVSRKYNVFHLVVEEGGHCRSNKDSVYRQWRELLGERTIPLVDYTKLSEVIVSIIEMLEGRDRNAVIGSWDGKTSMVVSRATESMSLVKVNENKGLVSL